MKTALSILLLSSLLLADNIPLIKPKQTILANYSQCIGKMQPEFCPKTKTLADLTNIDWVDKIILDSFIADKKNASLNNTQKIEFIKKSSKQWLNNAIKELKEMGSSYGYEELSSVSYMYQRYDIATFKSYFYEYSGGAHGNYNMLYINIDLANKKVLTLNDILEPKKKMALAKKLLEAYKNDHSDYIETFLPKKPNEQLEHLLVDNFYFTDNSIKFVYNPYHIGPYSDGAMELEVYYSELANIIHSKYLR